MVGTYRDRLRAVAADNDGYVTPRLAEDAGVPAVELRKLAARGAFEKKMRGVYRDAFHPAGVNDPLRELLLSLGEGAHLAAETVLALHGLGDVNPRRVYVASPQRHQRALPENVVLLKAIDGARVTYVDGLPCQPVSDALGAVRGKLLGERFDEALDRALHEGLIRARDHDELRESS
ncbi:type IV toxin-antitoxin system AbiEi family antitoxin domain-containing protein [Corynebacterium sp. NPDC060344]|uniref:type IV toxin-antitoxin system AbiEi family antitoxin domain-containing protein n=1 Tax=Corynebacterium sp. NPDC060344 TaxID=3347101 RepID=UPI0036529046